MEENRILASWQITDRCNFNCKYCFGHSTAPVTSPIPVKEMIKTFKKTRKKWIFRITGGEPFLYPNFIELCEELTKEAYEIAIVTNLSLNSKIRKFANNINPEKVPYMYAATHIEEREKRNGVEEFVKNLLLLKENRFNVVANYVLHPTFTRRFEKDYMYFKSKGIELYPKPFRGMYKGKIYPKGYSKSEMALLAKYNPRIFVSMPFHEISFPSKGIRCNAGKTLIRIGMDGTVTRCVRDKTILGHILENVKLSENAEPCEANECVCHGHDLIEKPNRFTRFNDAVNSLRRRQHSQHL